ncbi:pyruvate dehydrogenase E2 component (dihydrolipoamide acetyltransferase) [Rhizobiales bacterium GAS113]|nr:pyruvate dehydrogenase E2 component (dihydrolipoamide acetyltransferase) [Rhizobiales bacterium GAS113]
MPTEVILPRVDMDMAEGRISRWYVENGASVAKGQPIFEIETDKAAMEVEAPASGVIRDLATTLDTPLPVGSTVAWIDAEGEAARAEPSPASQTATKPAAPARAPATKAGISPGSRADKVAGEASPRATPLARRLARDNGIDLASVAGSGPKGRVQAADITAATPSRAETRSMPAAAPASGGELNRQWLRQGEGTPLVLLHGFGGDLNAWRLFLATVRPQCPVLGIDLPGHGGSAARPMIGFDDMVSAVAETLRAERLDAVHLAGHSLGGAVATVLAGREGSAARSLFLVAPAGLGPDINGAFISGFLRARSAASLAPWMRLLASDPTALGSAFVEATLRQRQAESAQEGLEQVSARLFPDGTQAFDVRPILEHLAIPVKLVFGSDDRIIPARHSQGLPGQVAVHLFAGIGHMPHFEARDQVARLARELMRSA